MSERGRSETDLIALSRVFVAPIVMLLASVVSPMNLHIVRSATAAQPEPQQGKEKAKETSDGKTRDELLRSVLPPPLSLAYVPRDTVLIAAIRIPALINCPALTSVNEFLAKSLNLTEQIGISPDQIDQLVVLRFAETDYSTAFIFHLAHEMDAAAMVKALQPDPEESEYFGRTYARPKVDGKPICVFGDGRTVVAAQDEMHLRRLIIAGRDGATMAKWAKTWHSEATADVLGLANIRSLRSRAVLEGPSDLLSGLPAEFAPLREASTALVAMTAANEIRVKVQLAGQDSGDAKRLDEAMKIIIDFSQVGLSLMRVEASSKSDTKGASQLELLDQLDAVLDTVGTKAVDNRLVEAATVITAADAAKIAGNIVALFARE